MCKILVIIRIADHHCKGPQKGTPRVSKSGFVIKNDVKTKGESGEEEEKDENEFHQMLRHRIEHQSVNAKCGQSSEKKSHFSPSE